MAGAALNPAFGLTAEDLALLNTDQFGKLLGATDRLRERLLAEQARRLDEARRRYNVLGRDATATCVAHRRLVRWLPSPCWWYHDDLEDDPRPPEVRQCRLLLGARAPIVLAPREVPDE